MMVAVYLSREEPDCSMMETAYEEILARPTEKAHYTPANHIPYIYFAVAISKPKQLSFYRKNIFL
jgi:hypothetical protein